MRLEELLTIKPRLPLQHLPVRRREPVASREQESCTLPIEASCGIRHEPGCAVGATDRGPLVRKIIGVAVALSYGGRLFAVVISVDLSTVVWVETLGGLTWVSKEVCIKQMYRRVSRLHRTFEPTRAAIDSSYSIMNECTSGRCSNQLSLPL
ncbi:hypothetical protein T440DRAFT_254142 [Plenodomus tracheiphilus IPT5]|uniref:Uncharacterized protein n=1 Tax=Plenodomus tracheiphilus IPT5 TaxID=1408161 RepID=A0A6A7ARA5_9PLEO|nr:hypothetical protein T440DRAFT_254142 [Plenodomus tracheiphilus IPT5]